MKIKFQELQLKSSARPRLMQMNVQNYKKIVVLPMTKPSDCYFQMWQQISPPRRRIGTQRYSRQIISPRRMELCRRIRPSSRAASGASTTLAAAVQQLGHHYQGPWITASVPPRNYSGILHCPRQMSALEPAEKENLRGFVTTISLSNCTLYLERKFPNLFSHQKQKFNVKFYFFFYCRI